MKTGLRFRIKGKFISTFMIVRFFCKITFKVEYTVHVQFYILQIEHIGYLIYRLYNLADK